MIIEDIINHLVNKQVFFDVIDVSILNTGTSGAKLYGVTDKSGKYVVKQSKGINNNNDDILYWYKKEYNFYTLMKDLDLDIPRVKYSL
jgi:hypothetical protein